MIFSNASKGCRLQGFVHVFSFTHKYTAINVYVHCILYLYVYTIITWKIFTTIFETVEHKNSLCCWSTPKKNRQKFWAISHGNFLRAFRISKKRLEYGRPVNLVKIRFRSGGFGGGKLSTVPRVPGPIGITLSCIDTGKTWEKDSYADSEDSEECHQKKQKPWKKYLTSKKKVYVICITSVWGSHFSWVFSIKKNHWHLHHLDSS